MLEAPSTTAEVELRWQAILTGSLIAHAAVLGAAAAGTPPLSSDDEVWTEDIVHIQWKFEPTEVREPFFRRRIEEDDIAWAPLIDFASIGLDPSSLEAAILPREILSCFPEGTLPPWEPLRVSSPPLPGAHDGWGERRGAIAAARELGRPWPSIAPHAPRVTIGPRKIKGLLEAPRAESLATIERSVLTALDRSRRCHDRALRDDPRSGGRVTIRIETIAHPAEGESPPKTEESSQILEGASDVTDPALLCCIEEAHRWITLPVLRGRATVTYTITLRPGAGG